jgi:enamine deaminase RidA (YjgF/YER057c/UK114 family)
MHDEPMVGRGIRLLHRSLLLAGLALCGCATTEPSRPACFHLSEAVEKDIGFCQARRSGRTLYVSGITGQGSMDAAMRSVYVRLKKTLEANGLSLANVVKENVYATDLDAFIRNKDIRKEFYGQALPAATWVQVQRLYLPSFVVEIEVTAEYP